MTTTAEKSVSNPLDLTGRVAVVTGGAMGIGRAVVEQLAGAGARVVVVDTDAEASGLTEKELAAQGLDVTATVADVSVEDQVEGVVRTAVETYGGVDVLVNNAGIFPSRPVLDMSLADFRRVVDVNLVGVFLCSRLCAQQMVAQGRGGRIINITSIDALHPSTVGLAHYDASKHGVWGFTKNLALELAPHRIWVNAIAPGGIATPGVARMSAASQGDQPGPDMQQVVAAFLQRIPMHRMGEPEEIGRVALFLASDLASYMTGSQVVVDGGVLLT